MIMTGGVMATTLITVEEYLRSSYEPDAEYVDGVIEERPMGEDQHSAWQSALTAFFQVRAREWNIRVRPELRTKTSERRYRVPDVAIIDASIPREPIATVPPLIAFEVLSPEDRLSRLLVRLADFESMGVPAIYVIDPADNSLFRFSQGKLESGSRIVLRERTIPFQELVDLLW